MAKQNNPSRKKSKTSSFGVSKRESHDASQFYNSKLYQTLPKPRKAEYVDNSILISEDIIDHILLGDSKRMNQLPDNSVHLMITSPPYNVAKDYDDDLTLRDY